MTKDTNQYKYDPSSSWSELSANNSYALRQPDYNRQHDYGTMLLKNSYGFDPEDVENQIWGCCLVGNVEALTKTLNFANKFIAIDLCKGDGFLGVIAAKGGHTAVLEVMHKFEPNLLELHGEEILSHAAMNGHVECVKFLLGQGIDPAPLKKTSAYDNYDEVKKVFDHHLLHQHDEDVTVVELGNDSHNSQAEVQ
jgi:hypothetical protein